MLKNVMLVGIGGFAGSALRYLMSMGIAAHSGSFQFPLGTLSVNVAGSLIIGLVMGAMPPGGWQLLLVAGFCGGFTTFSTFSFETFMLLSEGKTIQGLGYILASVLLCVGAAFLGFLAASKLIR